jgi:hypothetical protein
MKAGGVLGDAAAGKEAMQAILKLIEQKASELGQSPIIQFLRDKSLDPRQRFSFVPCVAPWVFGFSDINKYVLRDDTSGDSLQQMINTHTTEDDHHWEMYVRDLEALEMNDARDYASALKLLWGNESKRTRQVVYWRPTRRRPSAPASRPCGCPRSPATSTPSSRWHSWDRRPRGSSWPPRWCRSRRATPSPWPRR